MSNGLLDFFKRHPFWAIFIIVFAILPMIGAITHVLLKAFGKKGIDNSPALTPGSPQAGKDTENTDDLPLDERP